MSKRCWGSTAGGRMYGWAQTSRIRPPLKEAPKKHYYICPFCHTYYYNYDEANWKYCRWYSGEGKVCDNCSGMEFVHEIHGSEDFSDS